MKLDVLYAFVGVVLTILWEFILLAATKPQEANLDPNQVFRIQGDLLVAALSLLMGAHFAAADQAKKSALNPAFFVLVGSTLALLALAHLAGRDWAWVRCAGEWLSIVVPDIVAAGTLLTCIVYAHKAK